MIATEVLKELSECVDVPVIFANQSAPKPKYPFITIKTMTANNPNGNHPSIINENNTDGINQTFSAQVTSTISVTALGNEDVSQEVQSVHDWFSFIGYRKLKEKGLIISDVGSIANRDSLIVDDYERKQGFDVLVRYVKVVERNLENIELVETTIKKE